MTKNSLNISKNKKVKKAVSGLSWLAAILVSIWICFNISQPALFKALLTFAKLLFYIILATFIGTILELRSWLRYFTVLCEPFVKFARLPEISGKAMVMSVMSNTSASIMLAENYKNSKITRKEMIISALCNSYPAMVSFSIRIAFPVIVAIGLAGLMYYLAIYLIGLFLFLLIILYSRATSHAQDSVKMDKVEVCQWGIVFKESRKRCTDILLRFIKIVLPMYLLAVYAVNSGIFGIIQDHIPLALQAKFSSQMLTVIGARLGGMLSAAGITSELVLRQQISIKQVVCALLIGNALTIPIRAVRTNIPKMLGIFPGLDGLWIVLIMQSARLFLYLAVAFILIYTTY